jgi:predicted deacylase
MTASAVRVGDLVCAPGELAKGSLLAGYERDGAEIRVPTLVMNGIGEGPSIYVGALVHGNEPAGIEVIRRVLREEVSPAELRGAIIAVPIQNPLAYRTSTYHSLEDGLNANRIFPGDPHETLTNRVIAAISSAAMDQCSHVIDLHCNARDSILFNFTRWESSATGRANVALSQAFGFTTVLSQPKREGFGFEERLVGLLADTALSDGKPCITVELTPSYGWEEPVLQAGVRGVVNVLRSLDMLDGDAEPQDPSLPIIREILGPQLRVTPDRGGLVHPVVPVGTWVEDGDVVVLIRDAWGDVIEEIRSPAAGYVLAYPHHGNHAAASGDIVVFVAPISTTAIEVETA